VRSLVEPSRLLGWVIDGWLSEVRLREEVKGYRELIETSPAITYAHTKGEPKQILFMSPQIEEILGYPPEAWLRDEGFAWTLLHPDDRRRIEAVDALGAPPVLEYRMFARDGREVWWCDATAPWRDESSGEAAHVGVLLDITTLREPDRAIREADPSSTASATVRSALLRPPAPSAIGPHAVRLVAEASRYLREHLGERVDRSTLSRVLAVSPDYLGRLFKAEVGTPPHRFLIDLRIEAARQLLRETDLTITQIASRVGFASPSHFVATFRVKAGVTPTQFRRRLE
jgi:PAS domain S-box-containing protein